MSVSFRKKLTVWSYLILPDYIDLEMIHYVDAVEDWNYLQTSDFIAYVKELKEKGVIHHIVLSSHNPETSKLAVKSGLIEMLMFSVNPAFDLLPVGENLEDLLKEGYKYEDGLSGINIERSELYKLCEERCLFGVPIAGRMKKTSELFGM